MTDAEIREWLSDYDAGKHQDHDDHDLYPLLKELLEHRNLKLTPCWRVWSLDQSVQGWRVIAAFPSKEAAMEYRQMIFRRDCLILPHNEEPALTAR